MCRIYCTLYAAIIDVACVLFLQIAILFSVSVIYTTEAPALSDDSTVVTASHYTADGKEDQPATTVNSKDFLKDSPNCEISTGSKSSIQVALFYVNQTNFVFIAIDVFDAEYFSSPHITDTKLHENDRIMDGDYAGLVKAVKVNDEIALNLNGISPNDKASE